jgi:hypothetical protein
MLTNYHEYLSLEDLSELDDGISIIDNVRCRELDFDNRLKSFTAFADE